MVYINSEIQYISLLYHINNNKKNDYFLTNFFLKKNTVYIAFLNSVLVEILLVAIHRLCHK